MVVSGTDRCMRALAVIMSDNIGRVSAISQVCVDNGRPEHVQHVLMSSLKDTSGFYDQVILNVRVGHPYTCSTHLNEATLW